MKSINMKLFLNIAVLTFVFFIGLILTILLVEGRLTDSIVYMIGSNEIGSREVSFLGITLVTLRGVIDSATQSYSISMDKSSIYLLMPLLVGLVLVCITIVFSLLTKVLLRKSFEETETLDDHE